MKLTRYLLTICAGSLLLLTACGEDLPDVEVDAVRYELRLLKMADAYPKQPADSTKACVKAFDEVLGEELYLMAKTIYPEVDSQMLASQPQAQAAFKQDMCTIVNDTLYTNLFDTIKKHFPESYDLAGEFEKPFARLKKAYPNMRLPRIRTIALGSDAAMNWQMQYHQNRVRWYREAGLLTIGMEYFIGSKTRYLHPMMPKYVRANCRPGQLVPIAMHAIVSELHKPLQQHETPRLLDYMLNAGIRYEAMHQLMPELPEREILRYTDSTMTWANENEVELYNHLLPLLYESNPLRFDGYVNAAPFTKAFGQQSPPRIAEFIGWRIIQAYVDNEDPALSQLLESRNYTRVFKLAKYKP